MQLSTNGLFVRKSAAVIWQQHQRSRLLVLIPRFAAMRGTGGLPIACLFLSELLCTVLLKQMSDYIDVSRRAVTRQTKRPALLRRLPRHD